ncbi:MAG: EF-hand domain-containing protein [Sphingomicrobium sp.]
MTKFLLGTALVAAMTTGAAALAQTPAPAPVAPRVEAAHPSAQGWKRGERNAVQTRADVARHVQTAFAMLDTNHDGSITKAEADAAKSDHGGKRTGHAGKPSSAMFDRLDANHDGSISRAEFDATRGHREQRMASADKDRGGHSGERGMHGGRGPGAMHARMFEMSDTNRDGKVTLQEATNAALSHFDSMDANRDGQLTPDERKQMHDRMRAEHKPG